MVRCLLSGTSWLSETPDVIGSKGWDAKYPRICTWGQFNPIYPMMMESGMFVDCHDAAAVRFAPTGSMNYFKTDFKTDSRIDHVLVSDDFDVLDYTVLTYSYWSEEKPSAEALEAIKSGKEGVVVHKQRLPSDHYPVGIHLKFK